jgi:HSP20 family protein
MATRTSGRGDERSGSRNASSANENTTRRQNPPAQGARDTARQGATNSASQSATSGGSQGRSQSQSAAQSQSASENQSANRTPNQNPNRNRDTQSQQGQQRSGVGESQSRGDQERELSTAREQGNMRPAASAERGNLGRESAGYGGSSAGGGANPFALMRRMMEDMDRLFSDFGFTTPGMFGSSLLGQDFSPSGHRSLGASSSGKARSAAVQRGDQGLQRSGQGGGLQRSAFGGLWSPQVEVVERGNNLVVRADLPGLSRENVDVELDDDALIIRGERRSDVEDNEEGFYRSERSYGSFYRAIPLPEGIDASACNATFKDGVLEVTLPKPPQQSSRTRRIDVRGG